MKKIFFWAVVFAAVVTMPAQQRLVVIGGGDRPDTAVARFVEWSGGPKARILIVTWASGEPKRSLESLQKDFSGFDGVRVEAAPVAPLDAAGRAAFIEQLKTATGIFFSGGDQNRIMEVLKDRELLAILRARYTAGVAFAGTSAGAAAMSTPMLTGENDLTVIDGAKVGTRDGLGLIPNLIFDQHFVKRQRQNRLFGLILKNPSMLGVGVDEDTAFAVRDNRFGEVFGAGYVTIVDASDRRATFRLHLLKTGERFDLRKRRAVR
jgi:cyanophycinase